MRQVFSVSKPRLFPSWKQWKQLPSVLSTGEQRVMHSAMFLFILSVLTIIGITLVSHRVEVPAHGGEYTEALIGEPQLINPLYAITNDADQDLVSLIYSGLLKWDPEQGYIPDLAESIEKNEESTVYTISIKKQAKFHNGDPVLARDVLFTISAIQNPAYRSPLAAQFRSISLIQEDDRKISFILEKPQPNFLNQLTVGILPSSAWAEILPQNAPLAALNLQPIGSGPYKFAEFSKDKRGVIRSYTLKSFDEYIQGEPLIDRLTFKFYQDPLSALDGLENKFVEGVSIVPFDAKQKIGQNRTVVAYSPLLSRETVLYFNQKTNAQLKKQEVRQAIAHAINKQSVVDEVLSGNGQTIVGPLLSGMIGYHDGLIDIPPDTEKAKTLLTDAKVIESSSEQTTTADETVDDTTTEPEKKSNQLTLTTIDSEEFLRVASLLKQQLELVGFEIEIVPVRADVLFDEVIKPRNFELLLATLMYDTQADPYIFWHSSQKDGKGLNIVDYENADVDMLLETGRTTQNPDEQQTAYEQFQEKLFADIPAIFLYQSSYGYAIAKKVQQQAPKNLRIPSDRFANIYTWYIKTKQAFQ